MAWVAACPLVILRSILLAAKDLGELPEDFAAILRESLHESYPSPHPHSR
jgi:hypothetical protein